MKGQALRPSTFRTELPTNAIQQGLKRYRRIAKQDVLAAQQTAHPEAYRLQAEARREVYALLSSRADLASSEEVVAYALELYQQLPFVSGCAPFEHPEIQGRENALENFFVLVGLEPKMRREARKKRPRLQGERGQA